MAFYSFVEKVRALGSGAITVREQSRLNENPDNLRWSTMFPRVNAQSIKIGELYSVDQRPMSDRRPWNSPGRLITLKNPKLREVEMLPIEGKVTFGEREMQLMTERFLGAEQTMAQQLSLDINSVVRHLNDANNRRIEMDAFTGWLGNALTVRNPVTGNSTTVPMNYDAGRYITDSWVATPYAKFLAAIQYAIRTLPSVVGCMMRQATFAAILADGPSVPGSTVPMTRAQFLTHLQSEIGQQFGIVIDERTAEEYQTGGTAVTTVNYFTAQKVAFLTAQPIGNTHFAPMARAYQFMNSIPVDMRDANGFWTFIEPQNTGKQLEIQAQVNAITIPDERNVLVYTVGV